jgi:hypothetical protein
MFGEFVIWRHGEAGWDGKLFREAAAATRFVRERMAAGDEVRVLCGMGNGVDFAEAQASWEHYHLPEAERTFQTYP